MLPVLETFLYECVSTNLSIDIVQSKPLKEKENKPSISLVL